MSLSSILYYENSVCFVSFTIKTSHGLCANYNVELLRFPNQSIGRFGTVESLYQVIDQLQDQDQFTENSVFYLLEGNGPRVEMILVDNMMEFLFFHDDLLDYHKLSVPLNKANRSSLVSLFTSIIDQMTLFDNGYKIIDCDNHQMSSQSQKRLRCQ